MLERVRGKMGRLVMAAGLLAGCGSGIGTAKSSADADVQENVVTQQPAETDSEDSASAAEETEDTTLEAENAETAGTEDTATEDTDAGSTGNTLIVYYSASASTKAVAEKIAADTGADLFEITPVTPYTSDDLNWTNSDSRVSFGLMQMPIISSRYWNMVHGTNPEEVKQDLEGMQVMHVLGENMAFFINCKNIALKMGLEMPKAPEFVFTNFIR